MAMRLVAATIGGFMKTDQRSRIRFSCLGAKGKPRLQSWIYEYTP
jgi:hypothetical protein